MKHRPSRTDIQLAHDTLHCLLEEPGLVAEIYGGDQAARAAELLLCAHQTLCWVLGHDQGAQLECQLNRVRQALARLGYQLTDQWGGKPVAP